MTDLHSDLIKITDAVQVLSATSYQIMDQTRRSARRRAMSQASCRLWLRSSPVICTTGCTSAHRNPAARGSGWLVHRDFLAALSAANGGRGTWDPDWTVRQLASDGQVVVGRHELDLWAAVRDVRTATGRIASGEHCRLRLPKEMRYLMKGFFYVFGDGEEVEIDAGPGGVVEPQWRFYWHLTSEAAATFIAAATSILNASSIPFRLKVLRSPNEYNRADAGVLYVDRRHVLELGAAVGRIHEAVAAGLRPQTPLLTHRLADGLALAEASPVASSYGQHRCRLIARCLWQSFALGHDRGNRLNQLAAAFQQERLDPRHPYLAPGSTLEAIGPAIRALSVRAKTGENGRLGAIASESSPPGGSSLSPLDAAVLIGRNLCRSAYWDKAGRLCNWMGRSPQEVTRSGAILPAASALGPELYGGSAGVALFLAQLYALTGDAECRRTALGGTVRSLRQVLDRPVSLPALLSLFVGRLGVAYAAHRVAALTCQAELHPQAESLLDHLEDEIDKPHPFDVIGGNAGSILALLALSHDVATTLETDRNQSLAIALGEQLCRKAIRSGNVWSWDTEEGSGPGTTSAPLTGMSHGASGIAVALLELHATTRRSQFLEAARGGFAFEDSLFDSIEGNWPDMRATDGPATTPRPPSYLRAWCHGAPGSPWRGCAPSRSTTSMRNITWPWPGPPSPRPCWLSTRACRVPVPTPRCATASPGYSRPCSAPDVSSAISPVLIEPPPSCGS